MILLPFKYLFWFILKYCPASTNIPNYAIFIILTSDEFYFQQLEKFRKYFLVKGGEKKLTEREFITVLFLFTKCSEKFNYSNLFSKQEPLMYLLTPIPAKIAFAL